MTTTGLLSELSVYYMALRVSTAVSVRLMAHWMLNLRHDRTDT